MIYIRDDNSKRSIFRKHYLSKICRIKKCDDNYSNIMVLIKVLQLKHVNIMLNVFSKLNITNVRRDKYGVGV